mmetsp:Transcript_119928/g.208258  ORF Transcript_119928/g.208258 Transcript_119928/m.208258 type:complete len:253 (+) Transcript_119928:156-914(+)
MPRRRARRRAAEAGGGCADGNSKVEVEDGTRAGCVPEVACNTHHAQPCSASASATRFNAAVLTTCRARGRFQIRACRAARTIVFFLDALDRREQSNPLCTGEQEDLEENARGAALDEFKTCHSKDEVLNESVTLDHDPVEMCAAGLSLQAPGGPLQFVMDVKEEKKELDGRLDGESGWEQRLSVIGMPEVKCVCDWLFSEFTGFDADKWSKLDNVVAYGILKGARHIIASFDGPDAHHELEALLAHRDLVRA